jgi:hypothetical protein
MAVTLDDLKAHSNVVGTADDAVLTRILSAATRHVERLLGFALDDEDQFPDGTPEDLEHAVLMLAADWFENREASLVGVSGQSVPFGVRDIIDNYRTYTFGAPDA